MSNSVFERILGTHCAPVLMGHKMANLVAMDREDMKHAIGCPDCPPEGPLTVPQSDVTQLLGLYEDLLAPYGIKIEILCSCRRRFQILFYRPEVLEEYLQRDTAQRILRKCGYPAYGSLTEYLEILRERFVQKTDFPHEIGLFLGYPQEDVLEFIRQNGRNFKACRYWKVYDKVEEAYRLFTIYDKCREFVGSKLDAGYSIVQIVNMRQLCASS